MKRLALALLVACAGCLAGPPADGSPAEPIGDAEEALTEAASAPNSSRSWIHDHMPTWRLYNYGTVVKNRRMSRVLLAVPDDGPEEQSLRIYDTDFLDDPDAYFGNLVNEGRLSVLDLIALGKVLHDVGDFSNLPSSREIEHRRKPMSPCFECTPSTPAWPDGVSSAGVGGPVYPLGTDKHARQPEAGGVHYGPGWGAVATPPPPTHPGPALPTRGFLDEMRHGIARVASRLFGSERTCREAACHTPFTLATAGAAGCALPIVRAIPHTGIPCAVLATGAVLTGVLDPWCSEWCNEVYEMFPQEKR